MGGPRVAVHVRRGDTVEVIHGKYRGKRGKVLRVIPDRGRIIVEGVMIAKRHTKPSDKNPAGGIIEKPMPFPSGKAMLVCTRCGRAVRFGHQLMDDGKRVRVCRHCGEIIDRA
ncbi:MAG TPA: 50S ribosomal protein L24 [bacterium]|jgi:large subunit ribosomal protein L24|nr:50S ribosomal protein L24 [bacterium]